VSDTGTGIPAEELPPLFERFHRVKGARGRTFEGSCIGLAHVQELVKLHGGATRVESEVDRGSAFTVTIPLGKSHLPARDRAPAYCNLNWLHQTHVRALCPKCARAFFRNMHPKYASNFAFRP
jgi:hypothetical protein